MDKRKPLDGRRIVLTRAPAQAGTLFDALRDQGAEVILLPTVCFTEVEDTQSLDREIRALKTFDWVFLTSQNAVRFLTARMKALTISFDKLTNGRARFASVGPATTSCAEAFGLPIAYTARHLNGRSLAEELRAEVVGRRVLLPRSDRAGKELPTLLRSSGADVTEVVIYRTRLAESIPEEDLETIRNGRVDAIVIASPSSYEKLQEAIGAADMKNLGQRIALVAIGATTAGRVRRDGTGTTVLQAEEASVSGIVNTLVGYFCAPESRPSSR